MNEITLSEAAAALLARWHEARGANALPDAKFIDPVKLRDWVGDISVIHLHEGERRLFVALHGANVVRHLGPDFHQKYLEDAAPEGALENTTAPYDLSIKTRQPTYSIQRTSIESGLYKPLERMILPCSLDNPEAVGRFLVWVAPIGSKSPKSSSKFIRYDTTSSTNEEVDPAELYLLSAEYTAKNSAN